MGSKSLGAVNRPSSVSDRGSFQTSSPLTEVQASTDRLVSVSIQEGTNLKTAATMLTAGWVGRATRLGGMTSAPGQNILAHAIRGISYVPALAAESAAFAGIEREFRFEGQKTTQPFQKDWARAAVTLTGLKLFGGIIRGQNIILQHLFTDVGLVGGQHTAHAAGLMDRAQGSLAQQMLQAEAMNWQMKGSLAVAHSLSPRLSAAERSLDIFLKNREPHLSYDRRAFPLFSPFTPVTEGGPDLAMMSSNNGKSGAGKNRWRPWRLFEGLLGAPKAGKPSKPIETDLEKALSHPDAEVRRSAAQALIKLKGPEAFPVLRKALK